MNCFNRFNVLLRKRILNYKSSDTIAILKMDAIAPDKDWRQLGIYPPLFGLIGYFKF